MCTEQTLEASIKRKNIIFIHFLITKCYMVYLITSVKEKGIQVDEVVPLFLINLTHIHTKGTFLKHF